MKVLPEVLLNDSGKRDAQYFEKQLIDHGEATVYKTNNIGMQNIESIHLAADGYLPIADHATTIFIDTGVPLQVVSGAYKILPGQKVWVQELDTEIPKPPDDSMDVVMCTIISSKAIIELNHYLYLTQGWDGYNGEPFEQSIINRAIDMVEYFDSLFKKSRIIPKEITPGPVSDGTINIELAYGDKYSILSINPDDSDKLFIYEEDLLAESEKEYIIDQNALGIWFSRFIS